MREQVELLRHMHGIASADGDDKEAGAAEETEDEKAERFRISFAPVGYREGGWSYMG